MKTSINLQKELRIAQFSSRLTIASFILIALMVTSVNAQDKYTRPSFYGGLAAGANFNFYRGTTQELNSSLTVPTPFGHGMGAGLYLAPLVEYHRPDSRLGVMLQAGYDNRSGSFQHVITPCNCRADLSTNLSYVTIEPSLRFAPFRGNFYLFGGPRIAFNIDKSFTYSQKINPAVPTQVPTPDVKGDFSNTYSTLLSMQVGAGYDIQLSSEYRHTQYVLSPFVSFQPYFGQDPRSIETWTNTTVRVGAALKLGRGHLITSPKEKEAPMAVVVADPTVKFSVISPANIKVDRRVRETFPLRNYIFFNLESTEIPDRYVLLTRSQVKDFKEDQLEVFTPKKLSGRSDREMVVYYNVLNILGDRMGKNPSSKIILRGASMQGKPDGKKMAESVKGYLVNVFGINQSRITTEGQIKPIIASELPGATKELVLLREADRRVTISSTSPDLLMEFQSGYDIPLKPVAINNVQTAPVESYITVNVVGAQKAFSSWSLDIADEKGTTKNFGPYTLERVNIPGQSIMNERPEGKYKVTMLGLTKSGKNVRKDTTLAMVLWAKSEREEGMRYSVIYEFNNSKAIGMYDKYLKEVVTPQIPKDGTVVIHGYTDTIGEAAHNLELSLARANDVKGIIEKALRKAERKDVKFEVYGFGEDPNLSPFANDFPEERFYNRTVVIDIIPHK